MSEKFWLVFWGVVFTAAGAIGAALLNSVIWVGAVIGLIVYLILLGIIYSSGGPGNFIFIDLD